MRSRSPTWRERAEADRERSRERRRSSLARPNRPIYGNFPRYYSIRNPTSTQPFDASAGSHSIESLVQTDSTELDLRIPPILSFLQHSIPKDEHQPIKAILDLGCNSGKVTIQLAQMLAHLSVHRLHIQPPNLMLGVDIDPILIEEAEQSAKLAWSRCKPSDQAYAASGSSMSKDSINMLPPTATYFPNCFSHLYRPIRLPERSHPRPSEPDRCRKKKRKRTNSDAEQPATAAGESLASDSVLAFQALQFTTAEWVNADLHLKDEGADGRRSRMPWRANREALSLIESSDSEGYDVVLCLALTKWVHIHHGDRGMSRLFARISKCLRPGGKLILERQEWKSYEETRRLGSELRSKMGALQLRPDGDFDWILESVGLERHGQIGDSPGMGKSPRDGRVSSFTER